MEIIHHSSTIKEFNKVKYYKETGREYFLSNKKCRLHRVIWEYFIGSIPEGFHIHHIDGNPLNNKLENLECIPGSKHIQLHWKEDYEARKKAVLQSLYKATEAAKEWHSSEEGHTWHKEQYERTKEVLHAATVENECSYCHIKYMSVRKGKFCSKNCKTRYRYHNKQDHVYIPCKWCSTSFEKNRYASTQFCSRICSSKHTAKIKNQRKSSKRPSNLTYLFSNKVSTQE